MNKILQPLTLLILLLGFHAQGVKQADMGTVPEALDAAAASSPHASLGAGADAFDAPNDTEDFYTETFHRDFAEQQAFLAGIPPQAAYGYIKNINTSDPRNDDFLTQLLGMRAQTPKTDENRMFFERVRTRLLGNGSQVDTYKGLYKTIINPLRAFMPSGFPNPGEKQNSLLCLIPPLER